MKRKILLGTISCSLVLGLMLSGCSKQETSEKEETKQAVELATISTEDVKKNVGNSEYVFVDTRNDSYYNGFKEEGVNKGGHIQGAVQYTADWIDKVNKEKLPKYIEDKGIAKGKKVVVYDTNADNVQKVGALLKEQGYDVFAYDKFAEYANDESNKLESFKNYNLVVNAKWLNDAMENKNPETFKGNDLMVFEASWGPVDKAKAYNEEHIKGAYHFNTDWIENGPEWNLSAPDVVQKNLEAAGITKDKTVVIYSADASAGLRVMFALKWAGVEDVRYLNGGVEAWNNAGYDVEKTVNTPEKVASFGVKVPAHPEINISRAREAKAKIDNENLKLISIRSWDEYEGKTSGYDYIEGKGEPKGAIWGFAGSDAASMQDYYDPDNTLRNPLEIAALWEDQGINSDDNCALYCGTGWRASVPWIMTQMMGWDNFKVYDGGWNDWQLDKSLPVQEGAPKDMKKPDTKNDYK